MEINYFCKISNFTKYLVKCENGLPYMFAVEGGHEKCIAEKKLFKRADKSLWFLLISFHTVVDIL